MDVRKKWGGSLFCIPPHHPKRRPPAPARAARAPRSPRPALQVIPRDGSARAVRLRTPGGRPAPRLQTPARRPNTPATRKRPEPHPIQCFQAIFLAVFAPLRLFCRRFRLARFRSMFMRSRSRSFGENKRGAVRCGGRVRGIN